MNRSFRAVARLCSFAAAALAASVALAQEPPKVTPALPPAPTPPPAPPPLTPALTAVTPVKQQFVDQTAPKEAAARKQGFDPRFSVGGTANFAHNQDVVGQTSGASLALGLKIDAGLDYNHEKHEWRNSLGVVLAMTRTAAIPEFVKTSDSFNFDSTYLYHVVPWFGPFVRASVVTSFFRGADVRPAPVVYSITDVEGDVTTQTAKRLPLSDPFRPTTLKQSAGLFVQPVAIEKVTVEIRAGVGAQENVAANQLAVVDDLTTLDVVEVQRLASANQIGVEGAVAVWGAFSNKRVTYRFEADVLTPLAYTKLPLNRGKTSLQLTNVQLAGTLSFKLVDWASLDYQFKAVRDPIILDKFQIQNNLLLTFGLSLGGLKPAPPPVCPPAPAPAPASPPPAPPPAAK